MPTIVHFEIPSDNIERSKKFYNELFGWNIEKWSGPGSLPEGLEEYLIITTMDDKGNKSIAGGLMKRQSPEQQSYDPKKTCAWNGLFCCVHGYRK